MDIGTLSGEFRDGEIAGFMGELALAGYGDVQIALAPCSVVRSDRSPSHDVKIKRGQCGKWYPGGKAWAKNQEDGTRYFSIQIQSADREPLNIVAFADTDDAGNVPDENELTIVYSPPRSKTQPADQVADALGGDEVPF